ncbi:family 43 glycosylhydrolase [Streptomyces sp. NPDC088196]|uniref:family 43 glycosylhydrolase n=1 Tax=Streptomyces sp. NPDC088196 TaxID=3154868 RepID=UPI00344C452F
MTELHNPVIRGFAPDPSMVRVGDWYYVATSSFEWFPTIPIHRSRDLAHWEYAGHVRGAVPGNSLAGVPDSGGIWAPSLSWDGARFWMVYAIVHSVGTPYFDLDVWITTATDVDGIWAVPRRVAGHGFDPALFHHQGRLWLVNMQTDHRPGGRRFDGIVLTELDRETLAPVGDTHLLLQHDQLIEGPKLLERDGWFYLLLAEGGTGTAHGVRVARSRTLTGPYELDSLPLLTSRDDPAQPLQKAGHGELLTTPRGDWLLSHLAARPIKTEYGPHCTLGRETAIQLVVWDTNGWPRLSQGGWHPAVDVHIDDVDIPGPSRPRADPPPATSPPADGVSWPWSTLRGYADPSWADTTSRPGWIRLRGRHGPESLWEQSLLAQRITEHHAEVEVTLQAQPRTFTQAAGLILWYDTVSYLTLDLTWAEPHGEPQRGQQWQGAGRTVLSLLVHDADGPQQVEVRDVEPGTTLTLGATVDGATARFWTLQDGQRQPMGPELDFSHLSDDYGSRLRFTGAFAGIHARDLVDGTFNADFTGWRLTCEA